MPRLEAGRNKERALQVSLSIHLQPPFTSSAATLKAAAGQCWALLGAHEQSKSSLQAQSGCTGGGVSDLY